MVNGPASGGGFPLGREYWEKLAEDKGYEYDPNKNVPPPPKQTMNVPVGQTQQGEAIQKLDFDIKKLSKKEVAKLLKKAKIEQQVMMDHIDKNDSTSELRSLKYERPATEIMKNLLARIPDEDMANLTTKKDILNYLKAHPELKQSMELEEKTEDTE